MEGEREGREREREGRGRERDRERRGERAGRDGMESHFHFLSGPRPRVTHK